MNHRNNRVVTIPFHGTVAASSRKTLVSQRIDYPVRTLRIRASFAPGCNRLLRLYFFISQDDEAPTTALPSGFNIFAELGESVDIVGDDNEVILDHVSESLSGGIYLKVHAYNTDTYPHTIDAQVTIEMIPWEEPEE